MPVLSTFLGRPPSAGAYPALRAWRLFDEKPRTEVRGHRVIGLFPELHGTLDGIRTRSPPAPAGGLYGIGCIREGLPMSREPALAASEGRMPRAQPPSSERRQDAGANVRRRGVGSPELRRRRLTCQGKLKTCPHGANVRRRGVGSPELRRRRLTCRGKLKTCPHGANVRRRGMGSPEPPDASTTTRWRAVRPTSCRRGRRDGRACRVPPVRGQPRG